MASPEQHEIQNQNIMSLLDGLFCEEEDFDLRDCDENVKGAFILAHDLYWEDDELVCLFSKEKETHLGLCDFSSDECLMGAKREAVDWMLRVVAHFGFTVITIILAVNYFDRFVSRLKLVGDKPWMSQLVAVACLSLAAKVEETQVPLLLDLQVEESKYLFEPKTVQRMELLVLSTLEWKMNPVTPLSFVHHVLRRLGLKDHLHLEFLWGCERLLLSAITDSRFSSYLPSAMAAATMLHVIKEIEPCNALQFQNELMDVLKMSKDKVDDLCELILALSGNRGHKDKYQSTPTCPNGLFDSYLSCNSLNDSWALTTTGPLFKKSRAHDQQMRLAPLKQMPLGVVGSPR
ncbi:hypothetical protein NMG60_11026014 [Bertholletia excelsa]